MSEELTASALAEFEGALVRRKAAALVRTGAIDRRDREDVQQDLALALERARKGRRPGTGDPRAFARVVVNNAGSKIVRARFAAKRHPARVSPLGAHPEHPGGSPGSARDRPTDGERAALALDVETVLAALPADLLRLAELLMSVSIAEAARRLGLPRTTVQDLVPVLRDHFARAGLGGFI